MAGLVFQEIREFRSLAYSARGTYQRPFYLDGEGYFQGYIGTQADKTIEAIGAYLSLLTKMPEYPSRIDGIRSGLLQSLNSKKPNFRSVNLTARNWRKTGYTVNPNFLYKENYESIKFEDLLRLYKNYIQNKPITITVVGNKEAIDMEKLAEFGELIEVSKKDIFN